MQTHATTNDGQDDVSSGTKSYDDDDDDDDDDDARENASNAVADVFVIFFVFGAVRVVLVGRRRSRY